jgi:phosphoribosyl 1,2-cyclic phosphodiesterase
MINFCNLYSGSSGNSTYVATENTKILVDAGVSCNKIIKALEEINVELDDIDAIIITHEHTDHTSGLKIIAKKYHIPIFANAKTWKMMQSLDISENLQFTFSTNTDFEIGDFRIHPFSIPHDAADPCGFSIYAEDKKITVSTDIGHITDGVLHQMENSDVLLLEANYDEETLKCGPYPYQLKKRIMSDDGHLSNESASKAISYLSKNNVSNIVLGHLSKENNFPELAYQTVLNELQENGNICNLSVASRDFIDPMITL